MDTMTTEQELLAVLYALYLWDCMHWLSPGQVAFVRSGKQWVRKQANAQSFTLLNRMPIARNPASMSPGLIICSSSATDKPSPRRINAILRLLDKRLLLLSLFATMSATYLLLLVPAVILLGRFVAVWKPMAIMVLLLHVALVVEFYRAAKRWRIEAPKSFWEAFAASALNPLAALRAPDQIMIWSFSQATPTALDQALCPEASEKAQQP